MNAIASSHEAGRSSPVAPVTDQRRGQPLAVARELMREAALEARVAPVRGPVERRRDVRDPPVARVGLEATADAAVAAGRGDVALHHSSLKQGDLGDGVGWAGVGACAACHAGRLAEALVHAGGDVRLEAAAGRRQRERALDLVARPHAAPAGDAQLVAQREVRVAQVLLALVHLARPAQLAVIDAELARDVRELRARRRRLGQLGQHELDRRRRDPAGGRVARVDDHAVATRRRA